MKHSQPKSEKLMSTLGSGDLQIGYCTNVHAGNSLAEVLDNLESFSLPIKKLVSPHQALGIGLWFSANSAEELINSRGGIDRLCDYLADNGLVPFTFNGFPYGDFHESIVKHAVYRPTWAAESRLKYTLQLAKIQDALLPESLDGSISTLPIGWPTDGFSKLWNKGDNSLVEQSALNLKKCAVALHRQFESTGRKIRIAIEPEPGCIIGECSAVEAFFRDHLMTGSSAEDDIVRDYVGVCHDICHSAVMFESQHETISRYTELGIRVVKVQVSSAIEVCFDELDDEQKCGAIAELKLFSERRYLHQTCIQTKNQVEFFEELAAALEFGGKSPSGTWRVHFHVPIFLSKLDLIRTTQADIGACWNAIRTLQPETVHFEIETYAWNVLPEQFKPDSLTASIANEIDWFREFAA